MAGWPAENLCGRSWQGQSVLPRDLLADLGIDFYIKLQYNIAGLETAPAAQAEVVGIPRR
jgi:hypothetical protein